MGKQRREVRREERTAPTRETALKALPSVIPMLTPDQQWCAARIAGAYALIVAPVVRKRPIADRLPDEIPARGNGHSDKPLSKAQSDLLEDYTAWMKRLSETKRLGCAAAVLAVAVDDQLPYTIDRDRRWPSGTAAELLIEGLGVYARLKGRR